MIGEILALLAAICWALSAVLYKGVLRRIDYVTTNLVRIGFAVLFLLSIVLATLHNLPSVPLGALSFLMLAAIINLVIGDTLFFISLKKIGISRTQPISSSYPLYSVILAIAILGEKVTASVIIGTPLIVVGIAIVSLSGNENNTAGTSSEKAPGLFGIPFSFGSAFCYSLGLTTYKFVLTTGNINPVFATLIRLTVTVPILLVVLAIRRPDKPENLTKRDIVALAAGGILELGIGGLLLFESLNLTDASRAIPLSSTTPLFTLVLATRYTGEKMLTKLAVGTIFTIAGIMIIASSGLF